MHHPAPSMTLTRIAVAMWSLSLLLSVSVTLAGDDAAAPVHFENDIIPLFAKLGCNSGGCHGKASGQNGFKLSVFGYDPRADYDALVRQSRGRRVFPADPEQSLLVEKAAALVPHGGGRRCAPGSADHRLLIEWIRQGLPWGDPHAPTLASIRVEPGDSTLAPRAEQSLSVTAVYSDGSKRDVTSAAAYSSNAAAVADVDPEGRIHAGAAPGDAAVTVNYMGQVGVARVLVPRDPNLRLPPDPRFTGEIDRLVWDKLRRIGIAPSETADDAALLRRVSIDLLGTLPEPDDVRSFLADRDPAKRARMIDALLNREEFADYWALQWADVLLVDREALGERGAYEFQQWLRQQMATNRPYGAWVRELITATGNSGEYGPVNFYRAQRTPEELARAVSQAFLGVRLDCAQCHHHPFEKWAQADFYGMAGFFNGLERKDVGRQRELVFHSGYRETTLPLTGAPAPLRPPGGSIVAAADIDPRVPLAEWMTASDNPYFARLVANRLWRHFLGRGPVEPVDDLRSTNPASNEPLLAWLAEQVVTEDYDLKAVMRLILNSSVYQLSSAANETNADDAQNYSHFLVKRLPAEVLLDAVCQVTGVPESFPGMTEGTRAIQVWDNRFPSYFLDTFGRSERKTPCECGKSDEPSVAQALHLMNAPEMQARLSSPQGRIAELVERGVARDELVEELCLAAIGRPAGERERDVAERLFAEEAPRDAAEDFLWALLNSYDFLFVH